ncbi:hypothetical protein [Vibrio campbellii]|uniref:hypothetical protein n=1 Tax=Vibrio campbellii TaxID=680 RepID=UPI000CD35C86|nr:hypothetical protein [Vibrio campbellii]AUW06511.1 hypothetical protein C1N51_23035 [Vibrio campbellii]
MKARNALLILLTSTIGFNAYAITDASKIGANAGAMSYCYDHIASSKDKSKYRLLKLKTLEEYQDLDSSDRARALVMKKAAEDGDYLGDPLDKSRCNSLRKMLFVKY